MATQERFKEARSGILFSSDVSARGMDYPNISLVIQFGAPATREMYIHRVGRTARAGKAGDAVLILGELEQAFLAADLPLQQHAKHDELKRVNELLVKATHRVLHMQEDDAIQASSDLLLGCGLVDQPVITRRLAVASTEETVLKSMQSSEETASWTLYMLVSKSESDECGLAPLQVGQFMATNTKDANPEVYKQMAILFSSQHAAVITAVLQSKNAKLQVKVMEIKVKPEVLRKTEALYRSLGYQYLEEVVAMELEQPQWFFAKGAGKEKSSVMEAYLSSLRSGMAERRFKDLQAALKNVDTEALRVILAWRNSAHFLRANYLRETFLLGRNFAALRCLELRVIPGQPAVPMQVLVVELLLLRLDAMTTEVTRAGLRLVAGPQAMTTDKMESLCNVLLQCRIYFAGLEQKFPVDGCQQYWRLLERVFVLGEIGLLGKIQEVCLTADVACSNFASINEFEVLEQLLEKKLEKLKAPAEPNDMAAAKEDSDGEDKATGCRISKTPNCKLVGHAGYGLGTHTVAVQVTKQIAKNGELLLCYPQSHPVPTIEPLPVRERKRRSKAKSSPKKAGDRPGDEEQEDDDELNGEALDVD
eukprot:g31649.t1